MIIIATLRCSYSVRLKYSVGPRVSDKMGRKYVGGCGKSHWGETLETVACFTGHWPHGAHHRIKSSSVIPESARSSVAIDRDRLILATRPPPAAFGKALSLDGDPDFLSILGVTLLSRGEGMRTS